MFIIERDYTSNKGFVVRAKEEGLGRGPKAKASTIHAAQQALAHYYGANHEEADCPFCPEPEK